MSELPAELRDLIIRKAEGNPFFVEEALKSLLEVGALPAAGRPLRAHEARSLRSTSPILSRTSSWRRIDRLEEPPKKALQLASVIGREFTVRLLERHLD